MRGTDERTGELFSYVDLEDRVPARHPLRLIRRIVNDVLRALDGEFAKLYADSGRPSIAPERLLRALLLQAFYTIRSESQLMERCLAQVEEARGTSRAAGGRGGQGDAAMKKLSDEGKTTAKKTSQRRLFFTSVVVTDVPRTYAPL